MASSVAGGIDTREARGVGAECRAVMREKSTDQRGPIRTEVRTGSSWKEARRHHWRAR